MDIAEAREMLELPDIVSIDEVRAAYRRLLRVHHPDVASGSDADARTARLIEAYEVIVAWAETEARDGILSWPAPERPQPPPPPPPARAEAAHHRPHGRFDVVDAQALDEDTIAVDAPPPETFVALHEAASRVGNIAYVDRELGIIETMVRFEGGPTCSVVMTLQGRATFTEVFCTMESIEAAPTPPITPVIDALVEELRALHA